MIQNGIRLFYRHFLVTKEETLSQEELQNPMISPIRKSKACWE